jgi:plastocyanin
MPLPKPIRLIAPLLALPLVLAACGSSKSDTSSTSSSSSGSSTSSSAPSGSHQAGSGRTLRLSADPSGALRFNTKTLQGQAGTVTVVMTNMSSVPHAIAVEGHGVDQHGQTVTGGTSKVTVKLKPGTYDFYCPVDGHRQAGMEGKLVVS